jgi:hypothetical protein
LEPDPSSPLVSVVTPSLNQGETISATLESVRRQTYPHIEHIVVDGGSSDRTLEILREAGANGSVRWTSGPDSGMYDAINKGLAEASGEILAYLNSDDTWFPWTVQKAVEALQRHPEAGFVFGDLLTVGESGELRVDFYGPFRLGYLRRVGFIGQPTVFLRREVWEREGPFDASLQFVGDCDYWMRIGERFPGLKVNEVLALDRHHPAAKRATQSEALAEELDAVRARYPSPGPVRGNAERLEIALWRRIFTVAVLFKVLTGRIGTGSWSSFLGDPEIRGSVAPLRLAATILPFVGSRFAWGSVSRLPL